MKPSKLLLTSLEFFPKTIISTMNLWGPYPPFTEHFSRIPKNHVRNLLIGWYDMTGCISILSRDPQNLLLSKYRINMNQWSPVTFESTSFWKIPKKNPTNNVVKHDIFIYIYTYIFLRGLQSLIFSAGIPLWNFGMCTLRAFGYWIKGSDWQQKPCAIIWNTGFPSSCLVYSGLVWLSLCGLNHFETIAVIHTLNWQINAG